MTTERVERAAQYKVWLSDVLFEQLGVEAVDWGQPDAYGFYTPTVHTATWDQITKAVTARNAEIAEAVRGLPDDCHDHEGLGCERDAAGERTCYSLQRAAVLEIIAKP